MLELAARLPGVRIDRASYLRAALNRHCTEEQIEAALAESPAAAGIPLKIITEIANSAIAFETTKVTGVSTLAGMPGGIAMAGTIPADLAQYLGHMLRVVQKLSYLYSWPDLFGEESERLDDATENMLTLFIGVMFGVQLAQGGVAKASTMVAAQVAKQLPRQALTKGAIYPIVKKVSARLGVSMTTRTFASGVSKAVPIVGAVLSGGLTLATFLPMSKKLQRHLASLELTRPGLRADTTESRHSGHPRDAASAASPRPTSGDDTQVAPSTSEDVVGDQPVQHPDVDATRELQPHDAEAAEPEVHL